MIFGEYPCCGADLAIPMPERTPKYLPETCPKCGAKVWHVLSRLSPESFTEDEFLRRHEVDESTHTVRDRYAAIEEAIARTLESDPRFAEIRNEIERSLLYGNSSIKPRGLITNPPTDR